jgi:hypothetical protein
MKKVSGIALLFFGVVLTLFAVDENKEVIEYSKDSHIRGLEVSDNFFAVRLNDYNLRSTTAIFYSKDGTELFRKGRPGQKNIMFASPVEKFNSAIIICRGREELPNKGVEDDTIKAFDIKSGALLWQSYAVADRYEISPDGRYLLPQEKAEPDRGIRFEIIDLSDGTIFSPSVSLAEFHAAWYDSSRIILVTQEYIPNPNRTKNPIEILSEKRRTLITERSNTSYSLRYDNNLKPEEREKLSRRLNEMEQELEDLNEEIKNNYKSLPPGRERLKMLYPVVSARVVPKSLNIKIFNWRKNQIELEKSLDESVGEGRQDVVVYKQQSDGSSGITVDSEKNIYILGSYRAQERKNIIVKLDSSLNVRWQHSYSHLGGYTKFLIDGKPWFRIIEGNDSDFFFLDPNTGNVLNSAQISKLSQRVANFDFSLYPGNSLDVKTQVSVKPSPNEKRIIIEEQQ